MYAAYKKKCSTCKSNKQGSYGVRDGDVPCQKSSHVSIGGCSACLQKRSRTKWTTLPVWRIRREGRRFRRTQRQICWRRSGSPAIGARGGQIQLGVGVGGVDDGGGRSGRRVRRRRQNRWGGREVNSDLGVPCCRQTGVDVGGLKEGMRRSSSTNVRLSTALGQARRSGAHARGSLCGGNPRHRGHGGWTEGGRRTRPIAWLLRPAVRLDLGRRMAGSISQAKSNPASHFIPAERGRSSYVPGRQHLFPVVDE